MLLTAVWALQEVSPWDVSGVEAAVQRVSSFWEWPVREVTRPMFAALMGRPVGRPLYESIVLLDIDLTRACSWYSMALPERCTRREGRVRDNRNSRWSPGGQ